MACIDYSGNAGVNPNEAHYSDHHGHPYPSNTGVLLLREVSDLSKGVPYQWITDGLSKTILIFEWSGVGLGGGQARGVWASGLNCNYVGHTHRNVSLINPPPAKVWEAGPNVPMFSDHPGGVNILMCDGSVRYLAASTEKPRCLGITDACIRRSGRKWRVRKQNAYDERCGEDFCTDLSDSLSSHCARRSPPCIVQCRRQAGILDKIVEIRS